MVILTLCGVVFAAATMVAVVLKSDPSMTWTIWLLSLGAFGGFATWALRQAAAFRRYQFILDDHGFADTRRNQGGRPFPWARVAALHGRSAMQCLDLRSSDGTLLGRLEYQVNGVEEAIAEIVDHVSPAWIIPAVFHRRMPGITRLVYTFLSVGLLTLAAAQFRAGGPVRGWLGSAAIAAALPGAWLLEGLTALKRTTITDRGVVIEFRSRRREIEWRNVSGVDLEARNVPNGVLLDVNLALTGGEVAQIAPFGADAIQLFVTARAASARSPGEIAQ